MEPDPETARLIDQEAEQADATRDGLAPPSVVGERQKRYRRAMQVALTAMAEAAESGRQVPSWTREELYERP